MSQDNIYPTRPDLNGLTIQQPGQAAQYLVVNGLLQHIPDPQTAKNILVNNYTITAMDVIDLPKGPDLTQGAVLAKGSTATVYLISNGTKHGIPSPDVAAQYQFDLGKTQVVAQVIIDSIPTGSDIQARTTASA